MVYRLSWVSSGLSTDLDEDFIPQLSDGRSLHDDVNQQVCGWSFPTHLSITHVRLDQLEHLCSFLLHQLAVRLYHRLLNQIL